MRRRITAAVLCTLLALGTLSLVEAARKKKPGEPDRVIVQHVLVGFKRSVRGKVIDRNRKEAQALAARLLERAQGGEEFDALVEEYTDDSYPGIYAMVNHGVFKKTSADFERTGMVPYFGDVAFGLEVGEVGMAKHHAANSAYGWHIIKRLE